MISKTSRGKTKSLLFKLGMSAFIGSLTLATGCGSDSTGGTTSANLSGTINPIAFTSLFAGFTNHSLSSLNQLLRSPANSTSHLMTTSLSGLSVYCSTFTVPVQHVTGAINSDGSFNLDISSMLGVPLSCSLVNGIGESKGTFLISDSSKKDMGGKDQVTSTIALNSGASLGGIPYNENAQELSVPATAVASSIAKVSQSAIVFDPTGSYTISAVDFTLPNGVNNPCAAGHSDPNCDGPSIGDTVYMHLFPGTSTADSSKIYALGLWQTQTDFNSCGGKVGLSTGEQAAIGVDFSVLSASANGSYAFTTSGLNFTDNVNSGATVTGATIASGYEVSTATSQYTQQQCSGTEVIIDGITTKAWKCGPDSGGHYSINGGGGCTLDSDHTPVQPAQSDWSTSSSCTNETLSGGYNKSTCHVTIAASAGAAATCTNVGGVFDSGGVPYVGMFDYTTIPNLVTAGDLCSSIDATLSTQSAIAKKLCYANYYQNSGVSNAAGACLQKVQANWAATSAADVVNVDFRPNQLIFENQYVPSPDGSGGSMLTRQDQYQGVQMQDSSGNTQYVPCHTIETGGLSFVKTSVAGKLLATYVSSSITTDIDKPACTAAFKGKKQTYMFYVQ